MYRLIVTWLTTASIALFVGTPVRAAQGMHAQGLQAQGMRAQGLRMVTATGRAVINDQAAIHEAKNTALEDALYLAALRGGAKIDGFSSVQADTSLDDHFVVRPSSEILDYRIVNEVNDDLHYEVTVEAAVGKMATPACHDRKIGHLTMFAPTMSMTRSVPGWLSTMPSIMALDLYQALGSTANLTLYNAADTVLDPARLKRDARYDYDALVNGKPMIRDGDFAFASRIRFETYRTGSTIGYSDHLHAVITTSLYAGSDLMPIGEVRDEMKVKLGEVSPSLLLSKLGTTKRDVIKSVLLDGVKGHAAGIASATLCLPLKAVIELNGDKVQVGLGLRHGVKMNNLAMVSGAGAKWSVLRVVDAQDGYSILEPLSRKRKPADLNGKLVTFLEMN